METTTTIYIIVGLGAGLSVGLIAWLVSNYLAQIPVEDRQYKDTPPVGFKLAWWPIQWLAHTIDSFLPENTQTRHQTKLRKAGLDYSLTPSQFMAGQLFCSCVVSLFFYWGIATFDLPKSGAQGVRLSTYTQLLLLGGAMGYFYPVLWLRDKMALRRKELLRALPFFLDIITLCVEAGLNVQGAITQAVNKGPKGVMRDEFQRVLRDIRAGKSRAESMRALVERADESSVTSFCTAVIQAESMGMSLGPLLRAQADQRRVERFLRAEKLAMEAPVKMLFPLIAFIFPCTFIVLFFPIVMKFMNSGL